MTITSSGGVLSPNSSTGTISTANTITFDGSLRVIQESFIKNLIFIPDLNYNLVASAVVMVNDSITSTLLSTSEIMIFLQPVNDPPTISYDDSEVLTIPQSESFGLSSLHITINDVDDQNLHVIITVPCGSLIIKSSAEFLMASRLFPIDVSYRLASPYDHETCMSSSSDSSTDDDPSLAAAHIMGYKTVILNGPIATINLV